MPVWFHSVATIDVGFDLAARSGSPPPMLDNFNRKTRLRHAS
jgi:hypothetical protein